MKTRSIINMNPPYWSKVKGPYDKMRIWYLDFQLPEFAAYIEYFGMAGKREYDEGIKTKLSVYRQMKMEVIPFFPPMFREDWQGRIMSELDRITQHRHELLRTNKFWEKRDVPSPYLNEAKHS